MVRYEDLKGKRVLVTGASSGIGAAAARMFAEQGCYVGVHYFATEEGAQKTLAEVRKVSDGCLVRGDLRQPADAKQVVGQFAKAGGRIDILINNAGTMIARKTIEEAPVEFFDDEFDTNTKSAFLVTQAALGYLKQTRGCIVNTTSIAVHTGGGGGSGIYAAAKAALATLTIAMAKEFAPFGIRVNAVSPGLIETRFHEQYSTPERKARIARETPLGRNGVAEDIAHAILFLSSSEAAAFITGEAMAVNGGSDIRL